jgi:hypothetical protein
MRHNATDMRFSAYARLSSNPLKIQWLFLLLAPYASRI